MKNYLLIILSLFILAGCKDQDINDKSKRNADWAWWIDAATGKGEWIPIGVVTTVKNGKYTTFYKSGSIYETGRLIDGINVDTTFSYDQRGKLASYTFTKRGTTDTCNYFINNGYYKSYDPQGLILEEGIVKNHQAANPWITYYENGQKESEYKEGIDSLCTAINYYKNGRIEDSGFEINNERHFFICKGWYPSGQLRIEMNWKGRNLEGLKTLYYETPGQLESTIKEQANFKNGFQNGVAVKYYENGQIEIRTDFVNGKVNGTKKEWYENGQLKIEATFKDGIENGTELEYYNDGKIHYSTDIVDGKQDGNEKKFYENGQLELLTINENGKPVRQIKYDENGVLVRDIALPQ